MTTGTNSGKTQEIARKLTKAQRKALLTFPPDPFITYADGSTSTSRDWYKASELGLSGNTLAAMLMVGGVDPKTHEAGPALTMEDWGREGRHWALTDIGLEVRAYVAE